MIETFGSYQVLFLLIVMALTATVAGFFAGFFGADFFDDELSLFTFSSNDFCVLAIWLLYDVSIIKPLTEKVKGLKVLRWMCMVYANQLKPPCKYACRYVGLHCIRLGTRSIL